MVSFACYCFYLLTNSFYSFFYLTIGSSGVHCRIEDGERDLVDFFSKLGFSEITDDAGTPQDAASSSSDTSSPDGKRVIFMGRAV